MLVPWLTEKDPAVTAEGSLDPLSLYPIANSLAVRLIPGVRERQQHPRFLTTIAVALAVCSEFEEDQLASDGVSEPWQIFEWYVVEGLVRTCEGTDALRGLPGQDKTGAAIRDRVPLSAARYLVKPGTYGFHGVYRLLVETLGIQHNNLARLGETGADLLDVWSREQGLVGFAGSSGGEGADSRRKLADAVRDGMKKGCVARASGWSGWQFFADHLGIYNAGRREASVIHSALCRAHEGFRGIILDYLVSVEGQQNWPSSSQDPSERLFHTAMMKCADAELRDHLDVIQLYERMSRLLDDAFEDCLQTMTAGRSATRLCDLAVQPSISKAAEEVPDLLVELSERLGSIGESVRLQETFGEFIDRSDPQTWTELLLEHHRQVQRAKPPAGKMPWFEQTDNGNYLIRSPYRRDEGGQHSDEYVHAYRTNSLWSFASDLGYVD